ncbi:MAG: MBL fold metallo-hydrolase [Solirubrobacteraceae bacterium]
MIFRQLTHDDLGCASYLIGDEDAGIVAVVDPKLEIDEYLALARYMGVRIEHVLETHNHADHISGDGRLAAATGATIHIHRLAEPDYEHEPFDDGWELRLGDVTVRALHTPGHRPKHTAFALIDNARGPDPWAVLSGDTLFVGDIARPDLAVEKREGASGIFHSLHDKLLVLPGECEVWPGHLGGSLCGGPGMDMKGGRVAAGPPCGTPCSLAITTPPVALPWPSTSVRSARAAADRSLAQRASRSAAGGRRDRRISPDQDPPPTRSRSRDASWLR